MTGDQNKFNILKKRKSGSVAFGSDSSIKILGKGVVNLGNEKLKTKNDFLVEDLRHNPLSVGKMCDQWYNLIFNSWKYEIREADSGRLVATTRINPNNVYILDRVKRKRIESPQKRTMDKEVEPVLSAKKRCMNSGGTTQKVTLFHWCQRCTKKVKEHDDRGRMRVAISDKGGDFWMRFVIDVKG